MYAHDASLENLRGNKLEEKPKSGEAKPAKSVFAASSEMPWENSPPLSKVRRQLFPASPSLQCAHITMPNRSEHLNFLRRLEARILRSPPARRQGCATINSAYGLEARIVRHENVAELLSDGEIPAQTHTRHVAKGYAHSSETFRKIKRISTMPQFPLERARTASPSSAPRHPPESRYDYLKAMMFFSGPWRPWRNQLLYVPPPAARQVREITDADEAWCRELLEPIVAMSTGTCEPHAPTSHQLPVNPYSVDSGVGSQSIVVGVHAKQHPDKCVGWWGLFQRYGDFGELVKIMQYEDTSTNVSANSPRAHPAAPPGEVFLDLMSTQAARMFDEDLPDVPRTTQRTRRNLPGSRAQHA